MRKRWIILISNILSIILILICLGGCKLFQNSRPESKDPWKRAQVEGEFLYYVKNESAIILDLVDEEEEREELVIPETLGEYPVKQIGEIWSTSVIGGYRYYGMHCNNVKKIIINHDCYLLDCGIKQFDGDIIVNANVYVSSGGYRHHASSEIIDGKYIVANNIQINAEFEEYEHFVCFCWGQAKIVSYEAMGGDLKTFYTIVKDGGYLNLPHDPVRDGYNFEGWFKEEECLSEWSFEEDIIEDDITLYAKWIEA